MTYILNPGDGHDVILYDHADEAVRGLLSEREHGSVLARLYSYRADTFWEYTDGNWYHTEVANLPIKVLAVRNGPGPIPYRRAPHLESLISLDSPRTDMHLASEDKKP